MQLSSAYIYAILVQFYCWMVGIVSCVSMQLTHFMQMFSIQLSNTVCIYTMQFHTKKHLHGKINP